MSCLQVCIQIYFQMSSRVYLELLWQKLMIHHYFLWWYLQYLQQNTSISTLFTPESSLFSFLFLVLNPFLVFLYFVECFTRSFVPIVSRGRAEGNQQPRMCLPFTLPVDFSVNKNTSIVEII